MSISVGAWNIANWKYFNFLDRNLLKWTIVAMLMGYLSLWLSLTTWCSPVFQTMLKSFLCHNEENSSHHISNRKCLCNVSYRVLAIQIMGRNEIIQNKLERLLNVVFSKYAKRQFKLGTNTYTGDGNHFTYITPEQLTCPTMPNNHNVSFCVFHRWWYCLTN